MTGTGQRRGARGRARRLLFLVTMAVVGVLAGRVVVLVLEARGPSASRPPSLSAPPVSTGVGGEDAAARQPGQGPGRRVAAGTAAAVLHAWDASRASAYARGDPATLRHLYTPRSRAGAHDVQVLEAYAGRGLVVRGLRTQVLSLAVLSMTSQRLALRVTDRRVGGWAVERTAPSRALLLPRDAPSTRVLVLHHRHGQWQVASVRDG